MSIPIVTLDKIYINPDEENVYFLDCTRVSGSKELISRGKEKFRDQIIRIARTIKSNKIVLADDVVFSGEALRKVISLFEVCGIEVVGIISSIAMEESYNYFNKALRNGLLCNYVLGSDVIDQICERDFYFGIAGSGIMVSTKTGMKKAPYFKPYGDPCTRASIPEEYERTFSKDCLIRSCSLWEEINKEMLIGDLPEEIIWTNKEEKVVKVLRKEINRI